MTIEQEIAELKKTLKRFKDARRFFDDARNHKIQMQFLNHKVQSDIALYLGYDINLIEGKIDSLEYELKRFYKEN